MLLLKTGINYRVYIVLSQIERLRDAYVAPFEMLGSSRSHFREGVRCARVTRGNRDGRVFRKSRRETSRRIIITHFALELITNREIAKLIREGIVYSRDRQYI